MKLPAYQNEPFTDFNNATHAAAMEKALADVRGRSGQNYPLIINGQTISTDKQIESRNPADPSHIVGSVASASVQQAHEAIEQASITFETWRKTPVEERVQYLVKAAELMRQRKYELCAWIIYEVSKSWAEADADVAEAIDFCEFYAREMLRLDNPPPVHQMPGEHGKLSYVPLGVGVAIPPWNFPLAIMVGLTVAPLVCGLSLIHI